MTSERPNPPVARMAAGPTPFAVSRAWCYRHRSLFSLHDVHTMKALCFSAFLIVSGVAFAAGSMKLEIPGFSIATASGPAGEEWWMASTKPLELSRYALTNESIRHPAVVIFLQYAV